MTKLRYKGFHAEPEDLALGECTVRPTAAADGKSYWRLWAYVTREDTGTPQMIGCPINPNGSYIADGPGGKTWGLTRSGAMTWQVAPSINVLTHGEVHPGDHPAPSMWHQTPAIVDVPDGEAWQRGAP